jgi:hypothetical protein
VSASPIPRSPRGPASPHPASTPHAAAAAPSLDPVHLPQHPPPWTLDLPKSVSRRRRRCLFPPPLGRRVEAAAEVTPSGPTVSFPASPSCLAATTIFIVLYPPSGCRHRRHWPRHHQRRRCRRPPIDVAVNHTIPAMVLRSLTILQLCSPMPRLARCTSPRRTNNSPPPVTPQQRTSLTSHLLPKLHGEAVLHWWSAKRYALQSYVLPPLFHLSSFPISSDLMVKRVACRDEGCDSKRFAKGQ